MRFELPLFLAFAASVMADPWFVHYYKEPNCEGSSGIVGDSEDEGHDVCHKINASSSIGVELDLVDTVFEYYNDENCDSNSKLGTVMGFKDERCHDGGGNKIRSFKLKQGGYKLGTPP